MSFVRDVEAGLERLRTLDSGRTIFGAGAHGYVLNPPIEPSELMAFEGRYRVALPAPYREFLLKCGNGGAGPNYGLFPLGRWDGSGSGLEEWQPERAGNGALDLPFPHHETWRIPDDLHLMPEELEADQVAEEAWWNMRDRVVYDPNLTCGSMPISHEGCAYRDLLIVMGEQYGRVWLDGRAGPEGIKPILGVGTEGALPFEDWYLGWLEDGIRTLGG